MNIPPELGECVLSEFGNARNEFGVVALKFDATYFFYLHWLTSILFYLHPPIAGHIFDYVPLIEHCNTKVSSALVLVWFYLHHVTTSRILQQAYSNPGAVVTLWHLRYNVVKNTPKWSVFGPAHIKEGTSKFQMYILCPASYWPQQLFSFWAVHASCYLTKFTAPTNPIVSKFCIWLPSLM